jgi:hypothetical protein
LIAIIATSCSVNYTATQIKDGVNKELPKIFDLKLANLNINKLQKVTLNDADQRIYFTFESKITSKLMDFDCKQFRLSAKPALKDGKIIMTDIRADDINCGGIPLTDITNWIKNRFLTEIDVVKLSGMEKHVVKKIYIKDQEIKVKINIF